MRPTTAYALANVKVTSAEKLIDVRARQARRKALKPLLSELFLPYNLPEVLLPKIQARRAEGTKAVTKFS